MKKDGSSCRLSGGGCTYVTLVSMFTTTAFSTSPALWGDCKSCSCVAIGHCLWHGSPSKWQKTCKCFCSYINQNIVEKVKKHVMIDWNCWVFLARCYGLWYFGRRCYSMPQQHHLLQNLRATWPIVSTVTVLMAAVSVTTAGRVQDVNIAVEKSGNIIDHNII